MKITGRKTEYPVKDTSEITLFLKIMNKVLSGKSGKRENAESLFFIKNEKD